LSGHPLSGHDEAACQRSTFALRATVDNLRLKVGLPTEAPAKIAGERRLVDQNRASWNLICVWLRQLDGLKDAA